MQSATLRKNYQEDWGEVRWERGMIGRATLVVRAHRLLNPSGIAPTLINVMVCRSAAAGAEYQTRLTKRKKQFGRVIPFIWLCGLGGRVRSGDFGEGRGLVGMLVLIAGLMEETGGEWFADDTLM